MLNKFKSAYTRMALRRANYYTKSSYSGQPEMRFQRLKPAHLDAVLEIERQVYDGQLPWNRLIFLNEISRRQNRLYLGLFDQTDQLVGFIGAWFNSSEAHVTNIAVIPAHQHEGIGTMMLQRITSEARLKRCQILTLEVRVDNERALRLYHQLGFSDVRIKTAYYELDKMDALSMQLTINTIDKNERE